MISILKYLSEKLIVEVGWLWLFFDQSNRKNTFSGINDNTATQKKGQELFWRPLYFYVF